ncbi:MAG: DEAD/DEAH box helicase [Anaerolineales bacterium]
MPIDSIVRSLRSDPRFAPNITAWEQIPPREPLLVPPPDGLRPDLREGLRARGIDRLYAHQAEAVEAALRGENVVLATGTASGKTLAYNLPILQAWLEDPSATAIYLFPTKALAQDQAAELARWEKVLDAGKLGVRLYDGDTPQSRRADTRRSARLLVTNPDMLHLGILPHHTRWVEFLSHLHFVVLDELHVYRGVFGSHMANVLRRLRRVCAFYGASGGATGPQFLASSATIANPRELAERLTGAPVTAIERDSSPRAAKHLILYNPPLADPSLGIRKSYIRESQELAMRLIRAGVQTAVFARTRRTVELLLGFLRDQCAAEGFDPQSVRGYRAGYLPEERRAIEAGLRGGSVRCVVATSALELGVDIGGRIARDPGGFTRPARSIPDGASGVPARPVARARADQPRQSGHLGRTPALLGVRTAVFPRRTIRFGERGRTARGAGGGRRIASIGKRIGEVDRSAAPSWVHAGAIYLHEGRTYFVDSLDWEAGIALARPIETDYYTQASLSVDLDVLAARDSNEGGVLRRAWGDVHIRSQAVAFRQLRRATGETIGNGEIDLPANEFTTVGCWLWIAPESVRDFEGEAREILALTLPNDYGPSWPEARRAARERDGFRCAHCGAPEPEGREHDVHHRIPFRSFGYTPGRNEEHLRANALENLTTLCAACHQRVEAQQGTHTALGGLANALHNLAPLLLMCDARDLGVTVDLRGKETGGPTVMFYDNMPEGLGLSEELYASLPDLLASAAALIHDCPCQSGCPACVGPVAPGAGPVKRAAGRLAEILGERK